MEKLVDVVFVNPGGGANIYQSLGHSLAAIEPPLWCRLLAGYMRDRSWTVAIIDGEAARLSPRDIADKVAGYAPMLVVLVAYGHQPSASTQQMAELGAVAAALKAQDTNRQILAVGGHVAALPERTVMEEAVDFACNSEGPVTVHELALALRERRPEFASVPGLVWLRDGAVVSNLAPQLIKDVDADLHGDTWDLLDMTRYQAHNWHCFGELGARRPYASIYTSLGCPFKCNFCCINAPFGVNRYRMRSPAKVVAEIRMLYERYGVRTIKIIDEMFVLNDRHVLEICDGLAEFGHDLNIWAYARIDTVKPHLVAQLRRAGIRWLALGIESGSEHVRDGAEKSFDQSEIIAIVRAIQGAGINVIGNYIFGLPDDDMASMRATLDLALELNCEFANFYSAMAYPGSALYRIASERGWALPEKWSGYSQHSYDCTPLPTEYIAARDVLAFRDRAFEIYFGDSRYLAMVAEKFGAETLAHVKDMASHRLQRRLLETVPAENPRPDLAP